MQKMKEFQKVVQKISREQNLWPAAAAAAAYEAVQNHKITPSIPEWLNYKVPLQLNK